MNINRNRNLNSKYNPKRIYRLMKYLKLKSVIRKKRKNYVRSAPQITAENILNRDLSAVMPNEKWLTDVTEFKLTNGTKAYLSAIIDLYDNSMVSYLVEHSNNNKLVFDTFDIQLKIILLLVLYSIVIVGSNIPVKTSKLKLDKISYTQSMSRVGGCRKNFGELLNLKCIT